MDLLFFHLLVVNAVYCYFMTDPMTYGVPNYVIVISYSISVNCCCCA
jgi:hypothetical protein